MVKSKFYNLDTDTNLGGENSSDLYVASEKAVKAYINTTLETKQDTLVSGTNIKTVGGTSILGSGNITFPTVDQTYSASSTNAQSGVAIASAISGKANSADLATVATTGDYNDLSNKPTIPEVEAFTAAEVQTIWNGVS